MSISRQDKKVNNEFVQMVDATPVPDSMRKTAALKKSEEKFVLTEEQMAIVRESFGNGASPDLSALARRISGDENIDGRSKCGRAIQQYIAEFNIGKVKVTTPAKTKGFIEFTDEQKEFINNKRAEEGFSILFCARELFQNSSISPLHSEFRSVSNYIKKLEDEEDASKLNVTGDGEFGTIYSPNTNERATEDYRPPITIPQTIARINKYLNYGWKEENLKKIELKRVQALMSYLRIFRFLHQINLYSLKKQRELFEDAFIRYSHDKEDLSQEEIDQFITLSNEVVLAADLQERIEEMRDAQREQSDDSEGRKMSMGLNEAINNAQTEYNQCIKRQEQLYKILTVNRSKRIEQQRSENASILNLVHAWKQEENREKMIALAEKQKEALSHEVEKLSTMDELKAIIRGLDPSEIINT
jgi:hypothetical protein